MRQRPKSLMIEIDNELRLQIKREALEKGMTMKNWITIAILEKLNKEIPKKES